jgi:hypothetical protein
MTICLEGAEANRMAARATERVRDRKIDEKRRREENDEKVTNQSTKEKEQRKWAD